MPIYIFIRYTLTELFKKPDSWRQIYKQTSSTFYTSNDVSKTCWEEKCIKALEHEYIFSKYSWNLIKNIILPIFRRVAWNYLNNGLHICVSTYVYF